MKLIENYLNEIQGKNWKRVPSDLESFLKKVEGKDYKGYALTAEYDNLKFWKEEGREFKHLLKHVKDNNTQLIIDYQTGDSAWYSFKTNDVYEYSHESNEFENGIHYKDWIKATSKWI